MIVNRCVCCDVWRHPTRRAFGDRLLALCSAWYTPGMFTFTGVLILDEQGYSSLCPELDVASMGDTPEEAAANLLEAATLHLEGAIEDGLPYLRPIPRDADPRVVAPETIAQIFRFRVDVDVRAYA